MLVMTVFSFGAGQESTYLLHRIISEPSFREKHVKGDLIVVGADTGNEHPHTYQNILKVKSLCFDNNISFHWVTPDMGFHPNTWKSLVYQYKKNSSIGSAAFRQTCTDNLKVKVVDNFIESYLKKAFSSDLKRKKIFYKFYDNPIRLILGFAKGEESRISNGNKFDPKWKKENMQRHYPLIEEGISRQDCINYNEKAFTHIIWPSNCMFCFYQSDQEVLWLYRFYPERFEEWVQLEQAKLLKHADKEKNFGVYGKITLTEKLKKAIDKYGHLTDEQLNEYKFSHGHCIKSKY